jgi:hypothetical protein
MSGFVAFGSRWISLAERSHSSFAPVVILVCVQVRILLLPVMPMRAVSGRSSPMQAGFPTGTHRRRSFDESHSLLGRREGCVLHMRENRFRKTLFYLWKCSFGFIFCKH